MHLNLPLVCALRAAHIPDAESFCGAYLLNHWRWLRTSNDGLPQYKAPTERTGAFTFLEMIPHFQEQIDQAILTQFLPSNTLNHGTSVHARVIISVLRHFLCSDPATRLAGEVCCEPCGDLFISALDNILGIVSQSSLSLAESEAFKDVIQHIFSSNLFADRAGHQKDNRLWQMRLQSLFPLYTMRPDYNRYTRETLPHCH